MSREVQGVQEGTVSITNETNQFPLAEASWASIPKQQQQQQQHAAVAAVVYEEERPAYCEFCLRPFHLDDERIYQCCNNNHHRTQQHAFCSGCVTQYVENWIEDETWPELKQQQDNDVVGFVAKSYAQLPCLVKDHDDDDNVHYLPTATIRQCVDADVMRRFQTKLNIVASLSAAVTDDDVSAVAGAAAIQHSQAVVGALLQDHPTCQCCLERVVHNNPSNAVVLVNGCHCRYHTQQHEHFFCIQCIQKYIEEWLYGTTMSALELQHTPDGDWALPCLAPGDDDNDHPHYLPMDTVRHCVSTQMFQQLVDKMAAKTVRPETARENYILAAEPNASPSPTFYHQAAEALTEALMRRCPSCHTQFFKDVDSCNKVRCPECRADMCYVCRQALSEEEATATANGGYRHFCNHSNSKTKRSCRKCNLCPLWTGGVDSETDDQQRRQSVAADVANRAWEDMLLSHNTDVSGAEGNEIQRGIERLL